MVPYDQPEAALVSCISGWLLVWQLMIVALLGSYSEVASRCLFDQLDEGLVQYSFLITIGMAFIFGCTLDDSRSVSLAFIINFYLIDKELGYLRVYSRQIGMS